MTAKEYLSQAFHVDQRIDSKLEQVMKLRESVTKATATLSDMPRADTPNPHRMEDTIGKIVDFEQEINRDIDRLVDLKRDIAERVKMVQDMEYQSLLEKRYLCLMTWEQIAAETGCSVRNIHMMHGEALKKVVVPENLH